MALTTDDLKTLRRPFAAVDHEFVRGYVYIQEQAITDRIEEIDPAWTFELLSVTTSGDNVVVQARMTVKGVSRDGVGMHGVKLTEPEKAAATDAVKRCARLFGIGRNLLNAPMGNGNAATPDFKRWLADQQREAGMLPSVPQPPADPLREVGKELGGVETPKVFGWKSKAEAQNFVREMEKAHGLTDTQVFTALGVDRLGAWTQGIEAARQRVEKWHSANVNAEADKQSA